jgi:serine/threonine protein kinase
MHLEVSVLSNRSLVRGVLFAGLVILTAGLGWLVAIAVLPKILLLPIIAGLLIGMGLFYRSRSSNRTDTSTAIASNNTASTHQTDLSTSSQFVSSEPFKERYRLLELLASGRFGKTYVAEDMTARPKSLWVIKHYVPQPIGDRALATTQRLFKGEAIVLEKLKTLAATPKLLDYYETDQEIWFIREYVVGHPLNEELVAGKPISEKQLIELLIGILEGLAAIHEFRIIHRDIKPSNIIRRKSDNHLILIDFGAAKEWNPQEESQPMMTVAVGTASYASYEQMIGQPVPSSDIYSAGVIGIQAITGLDPSRLPLAPTGEYDWRGHCKISPKLADILSKMTRTRVHHRYQSAIDVLKDLQQL